MSNLSHGKQTFNDRKVTEKCSWWIDWIVLTFNGHRQRRKWKR